MLRKLDIWSFTTLGFYFLGLQRDEKKKESYVCKSSCFSMWSCWEDWNVEYGLIVWIVWTACNWSYVVIWLWTLYCLMSLFFPYFSSLKWSSFTFLLAFGDALLLFSLAPSYLFYFLFPSLSLSFWLKRSSCTFFFFVRSWMCPFNIDAFCPYPSPTFLYSFPTRNFKSTWFHWKVAAIILGLKLFANNHQLDYNESFIKKGLQWVILVILYWLNFSKWPSIGLQWVILVIPQWFYPSKITNI